MHIFLAKLPALGNCTVAYGGGGGGGFLGSEPHPPKKPLFILGQHLVQMSWIHSWQVAVWTWRPFFFACQDSFVDLCDCITKLYSFFLSLIYPHSEIWISQLTWTLQASSRPTNPPMYSTCGKRGPSRGRIGEISFNLSPAASLSSKLTALNMLSVISFHSHVAVRVQTTFSAYVMVLTNRRRFPRYREMSAIPKHWSLYQYNRYPIGHSLWCHQSAMYPWTLIKMLGMCFFLLLFKSTPKKWLMKS